MYLHTKAGAQADGFGFQKYQARPSTGPGLARLLASGRSRHITNYEQLEPLGDYDTA